MESLLFSNELKLYHFYKLKIWKFNPAQRRCDKMPKPSAIKKNLPPLFSFQKGC